MKSLILALAMPLLLSACADYPRDLEGTSEAIHSRKTMRIGIVAGPTSNAARRQAFIAELARRTGARPLYVTGSAEPLLLDLDSGKLDLVIGGFAKETPWIDEVAVIEPLATRMVGRDEIDLVPIARNGENRWVMTLETAVRDLSASDRESGT
jgi:ABC-type amino acid transport substrate-binding protein